MSVSHSMDDCSSSVHASSPTSTDQETWASSTQPETSSQNDSPNEVGEPSRQECTSQQFRPEGEAYSPSTLPQSSDAYESREAGISPDSEFAMYGGHGDDEVSELPSTTTSEDVMQSELSDSMPNLYVEQQRPSSTASIQYVGSYSPQHQAPSSTADYEVAIDNYERPSPDGREVEPYSSPTREEIQSPDRQSSHILYDTHTNTEISFSVSSSHLPSSSPHHGQGPSTSQETHYHTLSHIHHRPFTPPSEEVDSLEELHHSTGAEVVSRHGHHSASEVDSQPSGSDALSQSSSHPLHPGSLHCLSGDQLDPSFVRLVGQRFSSLLPPSMVTLTRQKEILVDSVMRSMIGPKAGRLLPPHALIRDVDPGGPLEDEPDSPLHVKDIVVSSATDDVNIVDRGYPTICVSDYVLDMRASTSMAGLGNMGTSVTESLPPGYVAVSEGAGMAASLAQVDGSGILVGRTIGHLAPLASSSGVSICHSLTTVSDVMVSSGHLGGSVLVQGSHIGDASSTHSYVSSSTGALDGDGLSLTGHTSLLDAAVDSTVATTSDCQIIGSTDSIYTSELEHRVVTVSSLGYPSAMEAVSQYSMEDNSHCESVDDIASRDLHLPSEPPDVCESSTGASSVVVVDTNGVISVDDAPSARPSAEPLLSTSSIPDAPQSNVLSRPRRNKQRMAAKSCNDYGTGLWCEECHQSYENGCPKHRVQTIYDKPVLTRAWASLPASYLSINKVSQNENGEAAYGVFSKKSIPKRTQFGPLEGVPSKVKKEESADGGGAGNSSSNNNNNESSSRSNEVTCKHPVFQIEMENGELVNIDTSDESLSNWMRFVQVARTYREQNLAIVQHGQSLYFTTTRNIPPRTELKIWYSSHYAVRRGLPILEPDEETKAEEMANHWPCFECNKHFLTSEELQFHLDEHDVASGHSDGELADEGADDDGGRQRARHKGKSVKRKKCGPAMKKSKAALDSLAEATTEALAARRPRGRPPKKFRVGYEENHCEAAVRTGGALQERHNDEFKSVVPQGAVTSPIVSLPPKKATKSLFKKKLANEWLCTHCDLTFDNNSTLNLHILTHAADVSLEESACFPALQPVPCDPEEQLPLENGDVCEELVEILRCPECAMEFHSKRELILHAGSHGKVIVRKSFRGIINPAKPHKCELCYKSFATEDRLQRHMLVHGNEESKPLQCTACNKRFLNNSALACHVKIHSDEKKFYECPICREEFDQIVSLKEHIHVHCINGLYTCPACQKTFDEYNQIRKHIRAFHSEKKFPCEHCDKIFPRPDKLKLHMLRHSNHREFLCADCGKQFKRKDKLKEHMKRMHSVEREHRIAMRHHRAPSSKRFIPKVLPTDYHRFIYKCHACLLGFKRRGMLVNHLAKRHPDIRPDSVPELNLPILKTTRDYYCQYCEKVYKSSSKRKAHIIKQHPGSELPMSNRRKGGIPEIPGLPNPTFSQTVGSITTHPHGCVWCHKQYASKAKLLQHQRKKHFELLPQSQQFPRTQLREHQTQSQQSHLQQCRQHHTPTPRQQQQQQQPQHQQYATVQNTLVTLLQQQQLHNHIHEQPHHHQQQLQLLSATTQTSELEFEDAALLVEEDSKAKLVPIMSRPPSVYVEQQDVQSPAIIVADMGVAEAQVDSLPHADLLTQAMSELTQPLADYHTTAHEYQMARMSHSCPPSVVMPSPASTPGPPPHCSTPTPHQSIEQSQLGRLLGHYEVDSNGVIVVASEAGHTSPDSVDQSLGDPSSTLVTTSTAYIPRTWASTYTDYTAR